MVSAAFGMPRSTFTQSLPPFPGTATLIAATMLLCRVAHSGDAQSSVSCQSKIGKNLKEVRLVQDYSGIDKVIIHLFQVYLQESQKSISFDFVLPEEIGRLGGRI